MDDFEQDWADMMAGNYTWDELSNNVDTGYYSSDDAAFEQDWNDVLSGKYTFDEVASGDDIKSDAEMLQWAANSAPGFVSGLVKKLGSSAGNFLKKYLYDPETGNYNLAGLATAAVGLYNAFGSDSSASGGYNKPVPKMDMVRQQVQYNDPNRRPGESGRQYFTDTQFVAQGDAAAKTAAQEAAATQAAGLAAIAPKATENVNPWAGKMNLAALKPAEKAAVVQQAASLPQIPTAEGFAPAAVPTEGNAMAHGGIANLAKGGRYLSGKTDGMADKIPTSIDGKDPAALSHGEFVIPADVVSHLGNGNSDAGAQKLYDMMARIRKARTGSEKQGKRINPDKFMPGGLAQAYAAGGAVKGFSGQTGSSVTSNTATGNTATAAGIAPDTSKTSTLSPWVGDYVTNALGQGAALANQPFQAYTGPLTAGPSNLQNQAFAGTSELAQAGFTPGTFNTAAANQYMNPYLSAALQPSLDEARREAQISRLADASRLTKAGAYGGGRQAIMESELNRNLMDKQNKMLAEGYATAYDKAMGQFNTEETARKGAADFSRGVLKDLADLGAQQRGIEQEGIAADKAAFEEQRDWAYKMPQYQLDLLKNLPIKSETTSIDQTTLQKLQSDISGLAGLYQTLANLGQTGG
jgi:hypothetical protein